MISLQECQIVYRQVASFHSSAALLKRKGWHHFLRKEQYFKDRWFQKNKMQLPPYKRKYDEFSNKYDDFNRPTKVHGRGNLDELTSSKLQTKDDPFIRRLPVTGKQVNRLTLGGNDQHPRLWGRRLTQLPHGIAMPGYVDEKGKFQVVKEMIPEFVVPDLTDFQLKPYVSYTFDPYEIEEKEWTAERLFNACYQSHVNSLKKQPKNVVNEKRTKLKSILTGKTPTKDDFNEHLPVDQ